MTYPFLTDAVPYAGQSPGPGPWNDWSSLRFWLAGYELPSPGVDGYTPSRSYGKVVHGLYGGLTAVSQYATAARSWTFSWLRLPPRDRAVIEALNAGRLGTPPFAFLPPDETNRLTAAQSFGDVAAWHSPALSGDNPPVAAPSVTSPVPGTSTMLWTPTATGDRLTIDLTTLATLACPVVPAEPANAAFWVWTASGTASVRARFVARSTSGSSLGALEGTDTTVGTAPRIVYVHADPGDFPAGVLTPELRSNDGHAVYVAAAQLTLTDELQDWLPGCGVPRVNITSELDWTVDANLNAAGSITLAEATPGAL